MNMPCVSYMYLNRPSLSKRSDDLHVRSTENFSKFTFSMRQWMAMPICMVKSECVCVCVCVCVYVYSTFNIFLRPTCTESYIHAQVHVMLHVHVHVHVLDVTSTCT